MDKKSMNNKGFTLVELIATIALLAVIAIISFVSINEVVNQSKVSDCENLLLSIKSAAKEYVSDNRYNKNFDSDNNMEELLTVEDLISGPRKYLSGKIVNPFDSNKEIDASKITIKIKLKKDYSAKEVFVYKDGNVNEVKCDKSEWLISE